LTLLEVVLDKIGDSNSCALPDELPKENQLCCVDAGDVIFLAKQFEKCALANSDMNKINKNYKILMLLLSLLNTLSAQSSNLKLLQQFPHLSENAAGELSKSVQNTLCCVHTLHILFYTGLTSQCKVFCVFHQYPSAYGLKSVNVT